MKCHKGSQASQGIIPLDITAFLVYNVNAIIVWLQRAAEMCKIRQKEFAVNEKKRARLMRVFRVIALVLAVLMVLGVIFQGGITF